MTKDEAIKVLELHDVHVRLILTALGVEVMKFTLKGEEACKALGVADTEIVPLLREVVDKFVQAGSDYVAILENARKGQLAQVVVADEWEEIIGD